MPNPNLQVQHLSLLDVAELVYFLYNNGYISHDMHERIHELNFDWKFILDEHFPGWSPIDLIDIVTNLRIEKERIRQEIEDEQKKLSIASDISPVDRPNQFETE